MIDGLLASKIHPTHGTNISPMFRAILWYLVEDDPNGDVEPGIVEMTALEDGGVLARPEGHVGFNAFLGHREDMIRNLEGWGRDRRLTANEMKAWRDHYRSMIPGLKA